MFIFASKQDDNNNGMRQQPAQPSSRRPVHRYARSSTASSVTQMLSDSCSNLLQRITNRVRGESFARPAPSSADSPRRRARNETLPANAVRNKLEEKYSSVLKLERKPSFVAATHRKVLEQPALKERDENNSPTLEPKTGTSIASLEAALWYFWPKRLIPTSAPKEKRRRSRERREKRQNWAGIITIGADRPRTSTEVFVGFFFCEKQSLPSFFFQKSGFSFCLKNCKKINCWFQEFVNKIFRGPW